MLISKIISVRFITQFPYVISGYFGLGVIACNFIGTKLISSFL